MEHTLREDLHSVSWERCPHWVQGVHSEPHCRALVPSSQRCWPSHRAKRRVRAWFSYPFLPATFSFKGLIANSNANPAPVPWIHIWPSQQLFCLFSNLSPEMQSETKHTIGLENSQKRPCRSSPVWALRQTCLLLDKPYCCQQEVAHLLSVTAALPKI